MVGVMRTDITQVQRLLVGYWHLVDWKSVPSDVRSRVRVQIRSDAIITHVPAFGDFKAAFLKIYPSDKALRNEVDGLQQAQLVSAHVGVSVPRILCVVSAENALLVEHLNGTNLGSLLRLALLRPSPDLRGIWEALACWLRAFHEVQVVTSEELSGFLEWWSALTRKYLMGIVELIGPSSEEKVSRVKTAIERAAFDRPFLLAWCHGDFAVHNIIINKASIYVTDFGYRKPAPREFDIERLFHSIQDAIGFLPVQRVQGLSVDIRREFMTHYGSDYALDVTAADAARLFLQLERLYFLNKSRSALNCSIKQIWRWYQIRRSLVWFEVWLAAASKRYAV
jgi:aminoglycoside phosphotransferase (APT) family kinase protein